MAPCLATTLLTEGVRVYISQLCLFPGPVGVAPLPLTFILIRVFVNRATRANTETAQEEKRPEGFSLVGPACTS